MTASAAGDFVVCAAVLAALLVGAACWSQRRYRRLRPGCDPLARFTRGRIPRHEDDRLTWRERRQFRRIAKTERFALLTEAVRRQAEARHR